MNDPQIEELRARVDALEKQCIRLGDHLIHSENRLADAKLVDHAFQKSIRRLGCELSEHHGVSESHFAERFSALCRWHYDQLLRTSSDTHPEVVSRLDTRRLDEIPTDDTEPRILREE